MKTIIFSVSLMLLAFIISPAIAQKANGFNANAKANVAVPSDKGNALISVMNAQTVKDVVSLPNNACSCDIPVPWFAKYISPLGFLLRTTSVHLGGTVINNTQVQTKK
jgi:hypothetical protein